MDIRIGNGFDVHAFEEGNFVIVGVEKDKSYALNANLYGYVTSPVGFNIPFEVNDMDAADLLFLATEIPKINIYASAPETAEGQSLPTFLTVTRTGNLMEPMEVDFFMEGTATAQTDYELTGFGQTNIADGKFFTKTSSNVVKEVGGAGSVTLQSVTNIGASTTRDITLDGANLIFEGNVANAFETTLSAEEPTTDNTVLLPNASGTLATAGDALAFSIVFGG